MMNQSERLNKMFAEDIPEIEAWRRKLRSAPPTVADLTDEEIFDLVRESIMEIPFPEYMKLRRQLGSLEKTHRVLVTAFYTLAFLLFAAMTLAYTFWIKG